MIGWQVLDEKNVLFELNKAGSATINKGAIFPSLADTIKQYEEVRFRIKSCTENYSKHPSTSSSYSSQFTLSTGTSTTTNNASYISLLNNIDGGSDTWENIFVTFSCLSKYFIKTTAPSATYYQKYRVFGGSAQDSLTYIDPWSCILYLTYYGIVGTIEVDVVLEVRNKLF